MDSVDESIVARICVRDPYFALRGLRSEGPATATARVVAQQPLGRERGPMAAAEAGRHLAILGSCAGAVANPVAGRHFYLARRARIARLPAADGVAGTEPFALRATARIEGRRCDADVTLATADGTSLFTLAVEYAVLAEPVFRRLFRRAKMELRAAERAPGAAADRSRRHDPYRHALPLVDHHVGRDGARARLARVEPSLCKGHFPMHPALPVAIVMRALSGLAGDHFCASTEAPGYVVNAGEVEADNLAFAGEAVTFEAVPDALRGNYTCRAVAPDGRVFGAMRITLAAAG